MRTATSHLPALDGLRGVAILSVLVFHFAPFIAATNPLAAGVNNLRASAWCGVDLFFVLSGFLITRILMDAKNTPHYFRNFYARRTLRIFPLYFGILFGAWAVAQIIGSAAREPSQPQNLADQPFWLWTYGTNIAVALKGNWGLHYHGLSVSHFWSLAVEEHFYLVWPAIVYLLRPPRLALVCVGCILGALALRIAMIAAHAQPLSVYVLTPCRLDALALGGLLAVIARREGGLERYVRPAGVVAIGAGLLMVAVFVVGGGDVLVASFRGTTPLARITQYFSATVGYTVLAVCFAAVLVRAIAQPQGWLARGCDTAFLKFFGKYSYGIYVYHNALDPLFDLCLPRDALIAALHSTTAAGLAIMASKCALAIGAAVLSWHLFEKPILRLNRYFEYREPAVPASAQRPADTWEPLLPAPAVRSV